MKQKPGEGGVRVSDTIAPIIFGHAAIILHVHLLTSGEVDDGADGGLVGVAVSGV